MSGILITGCRGQLGSDCMRALRGHELHGIDADSADITDEKSLRKIIEDFSPEIVLNCAAYTAVDKAESDEEAAWRVNAEGPGVLGRICAHTGAFLFHISTDYVFDGSRSVPVPWTEEDAPSPATAYGRTKLAGERSVIESGCHFAILRTAWLYGRNGSNFPKTMLRLALEDHSKPRKIVNDQTGCPTASHRLAGQIRTMIDAPHIPNGIYHTVCGGYTTWFGFASRFLELMNIDHCLEPCSTEDYPTPAKRPKNSILRNTALEKIGLNVMGDWDDALNEFVSLNRDFILNEAEKKIEEKKQNKSGTA